MARTATRVNAKQFSAIRKALKDTTPKDVAAFYGIPVAAVKRVGAAKSWAEYGPKSITAQAPKIEKANKQARKAIKKQAFEGEHLATPAPKMSNTELQLANMTLMEKNKELQSELNLLTMQYREVHANYDALKRATQPASWFKRFARTK